MTMRAVASISAISSVTYSLGSKATEETAEIQANHAASCIPCATASLAVSLPIHLVFSWLWSHHGPVPLWSICTFLLLLHEPTRQSDGSPSKQVLADVRSHILCNLLPQKRDFHSGLKFAMIWIAWDKQPKMNTYIVWCYWILIGISLLSHTQKNESSSFSVLNGTFFFTFFKSR